MGNVEYESKISLLTLIIHKFKKNLKKKYLTFIFKNIILTCKGGYMMIKMERDEFYKLFQIVEQINNKDIPNCHLGYQHCVANKIPCRKNGLYNLVRYLNLLDDLSNKLSDDDVIEIAKELKIQDVYKLYLEYKEEMDKNE